MIRLPDPFKNSSMNNTPANSSRHSRGFKSRLLAVGAALTAAASAQATTINFDDQGLVGPSTFAAATPSPQTPTIAGGSVSATFAGGVVLTNTNGLTVNQSSVYGTSDFFDTGPQNPITVTFSQPVRNIVFDVMSGEFTAEPYQITDNLGNTVEFTVSDFMSNGMVTIGLLSTASSFAISQFGGSTGWFDFFIDNIRFDVDASCDANGCTPSSVPEPASLSLFAMAGLGLLAARRRRHAESAN